MFIDYKWIVIGLLGLTVIGLAAYMIYNPPGLH